MRWPTQVEQGCVNPGHFPATCRTWLAASRPHAVMHGTLLRHASHITQFAHLRPSDSWALSGIAAAPAGLPIPLSLHSNCPGEAAEALRPGPSDGYTAMADTCGPVLRCQQIRAQLQQAAGASALLIQRGRTCFCWLTKSFDALTMAGGPWSQREGSQEAEAGGPHDHSPPFLRQSQCH